MEKLRYLLLLMLISPLVQADMALIIPPPSMCCEEFESNQRGPGCCAESLDPQQCNTCIIEREQILKEREKEAQNRFTILTVIFLIGLVSSIATIYVIAINKIVPKLGRSKPFSERQELIAKRLVGWCLTLAVIGWATIMIMVNS